jgi:hypothetical protein
VRVKGEEGKVARQMVLKNIHEKVRKGTGVSANTVSRMLKEQQSGSRDGRQLSTPFRTR